MAKILIVDDDVSILDAVTLVLEEEGYTVDVAPKGDEIGDKVTTFKPDLILLDLLMSGIDGRDVCRKLKADEKSSSIPIIMISAHPTAREGALECGANEFLAKPFELDELKAKIEALL